MSDDSPRREKVVHLRSLLRDRFPGAHQVAEVSPPLPPSSSPAEVTLPAPATLISPSPSSTPATAGAPSPGTPYPEFPLGLSLLDTLDGGRGLPPGAFAEIVCRRRGGGAGVLIAGLIQAAAIAEHGYPLALVDGADSFDAGTLSDSPVAAAALCRHLLWIRCRHRIDHAFKATDLLLRDGNLPLVILDLQLCRNTEVRRGIPGGNKAWYRLRALGERTGTTFLALTGEPIVPAAPWRLELDHTWTLDALDRLPLTGDLRREPIGHTLIRSRSTAGDARGSPPSPHPTPAKLSRPFAVAS